jgi:hypothetical protein
VPHCVQVVCECMQQECEELTMIHSMSVGE